MRQTDFARHLTDFIGKYLPLECGVSPLTIKTYSYAFTLLLTFFREREMLKPEQVSLREIRNSLNKNRILHREKSMQ